MHLVLFDSLVRSTSGGGKSNQDFKVLAAEKAAGPRNLSFQPTDDAFVWSKKPSNNYRAATSLRVRQTRSAEQIAYFKFHVRGADGLIAKATLRLYATDSSDDGGSVYQVSNNYDESRTSWKEAGLQWPNAPRLEGEALASAGSVNAEEFVEFDVTGSVAADGEYSYAVWNASGDAILYSSKEGTIPPELIVEVNSGNSAAKFSSPRDQDHETAGQTLDIPESVMRGANYPNPFNFETTIQYALPNATQVRLDIYNIKGQQIRKLVDALQPPGFKKITWNGTNDFGLEVSSGIYFARLKTEKIILTEKLLLQK